MFRGIILHQHIKCIFQCVEWNNVGIVLMSDGLMIWEGNSIKTIGGIAQILVSDAYLGYVINAITKPIDGRGEISDFESWLIDSRPPCIISRCFKHEFVQKWYYLFQWNSFYPLYFVITWKTYFQNKKISPLV